MNAGIFGEVLFEGNAAASPTNKSARTPWMPRMGDRAIFGIQVLELTSSITVAWNVEQKNAHDADGDATDVFSSDQNVSTAIVSTNEGPTSGGLKELVRYRIKTGSTPSLDWAHLRILEPSWLFN